MKLRDVLASWDVVTALVAAAGTWWILPRWLDNNVAKDLYSAGISVLSIVFAVFFAALAIIMASTDDDFVRFLEENGDYSTVVSTFRFSLALLFIALVVGLFLFG